MSKKHRLTPRARAGLTALGVLASLFAYGVLFLYPHWPHSALWAIAVAAGCWTLRLLSPMRRWFAYGSLVAAFLIYWAVANDVDWPLPANITPVLCGLTLAVLLLRDDPKSSVNLKE